MEIEVNQIEEDEALEVEETTAEEEEVSEDVTPSEDEPEESESEETEESEEEDNEDDRVVTIGDEEPEESSEHQDAPGWVKKVRSINKEQAREIKRLKRELEQKSEAENPKPAKMVKPTLKDFKYDSTKFEEALEQYYEQQREEKERTRAAEAAWKEKQDHYVSLKQKHNFKDFEFSEEIVTDSLDATQQGIIVQGAEEPALLVYALGKNPKRLQELSEIKDPVTFAFKLAKLEAQLKVTSRKAPKPEKRVTTAAPGGISGSSDKTLDRLREKAAKTGDYSEVGAYKNKVRNKE